MSVRILEGGHISQRLQDYMDLAMCVALKKYYHSFVIQLEMVPIQSL